MTEQKTPLMLAACAVQEARSALEHINGRLPEMRAKAEALEELRVKLDLARARRAQSLEDALLAGRTADTTAVDKEIAMAERAVEKRQDEATAVTGALRTLEAQRQAAEILLSQREAEFKERLEEHDRVTDRARWLTAKFHEGIIGANSCAAEMPAEGGFRERLVAAGPELLKSGEPQLSVQILQELVTSQADAERRKANELAAIPQPSALADQNDGYCWSDGSIHDEPEPPAPNPVTIFKCGRVNRVDSPPGLPGVRRIA